MSRNKNTTEFLKECMSDSLLKLMQNKEFSKITINEIAEGAGVNRSTWFRNFTTKSEALTFKLAYSWRRWSDEQGLVKVNEYTLDNSEDFFRFNYENRDIINLIYSVNLQSVIYDAFCQVLIPRFGVEAEKCYQNKFFANGLFGLLDEWVKQEFRQTPEEMNAIFKEIIRNIGNI